MAQEVVGSSPITHPILQKEFQTTCLELFFFHNTNMVVMKNIIKQIVLLSLCFLFLSSCSASKLLSTWESDTAAQFNTAKVLVIGVAREETKRRIYEDTFTDSLLSMEVDAVASYTASKEAIEPTEKHLREIVKKSGCDSVLITHMVGASEKDFYQPNNRIVGTNNIGSYGLYGYYPFIYRSVYSGGSYVSTTKIVLETILYDVSSEKRVWSARSESIDPVMTRKYYQQLIDLFLSDLKSKDIL